MLRNFLRGALVAVVALGWAACSDDSSGTSQADGTPQDDGALVDSGPSPDTGPACAYPQGPYGTSEGKIVENFEFDGYADADYLCTPLKDHVMDTSVLRKISFKDLFCTGRCPAKKKKLLWVMVSAGWCGPCQEEVKATQDQISAGAFDDRVMLIDILYEDDKAKPVTAEFAKVWTKNNKFSLTFPVLLDPTFRMGAYFDRNAVPFNMLVDLSTMEIIFRQTGANLPAVGQAMFNFLSK